jgi:hypothetical protein
LSVFRAFRYIFQKGPLLPFQSASVYLFEQSSHIFLDPHGKRGVIFLAALFGHLEIFSPYPPF